MANNQSSSASRPSPATIQTTIHEAMAKINNHAKRRALLPPRQRATQASAVPSTAASTTRTEPSIQKALHPGSETTGQMQPPATVPNETTTSKTINIQPLDSSYARELFFRHTNIKQVVAKQLPERSENTRQKYAMQLYRMYVHEPEQRIRAHLHEVRFDTRFSEGLFRMALRMPLAREQDWNRHKETLAEAGIRKLCFVDMTKNNCVLEYQAKVIHKLRAEFQNWSAKLNKLPNYLAMCQRKREAEDRKFVSLLKHHSSLKDGWPTLTSAVLRRLVQERWLPSTKRTHKIWGSLRFDDDHLNRKYEMGDYSLFGFNEAVVPELEDCSSRADDLDSCTEDGERCITPINVTPRNRSTSADEEAVTASSTDMSAASVPEPPPAGKESHLQAEAVPRSKNVSQNQQTVPVPVSECAPVNTTNHTKSTDGETGFSLEHVKYFTNLYAAVIENYFDRNPDKKASFTLAKANNVVRKFYNLHKNTFARKTLPDGLRFLTPQEYQEQLAKGPIAWVMEHIELQQNNNAVRAVEPSANPIPSARPRPPPPPPTPANQPKPKPKKKDPILRVPCTIRTAQISYDSDTSTTLPEESPLQEDDVPTETAHHSIAFVQIVEDTDSQPMQREQENQALSEEFTPAASSTQQPTTVSFYSRRSALLPPAQTPQDPLQLTGTSTTTIPPFHAIVPGDSGSPALPTSQSQSQPSSIIPPFQLVNGTPDTPPMTVIPRTAVVPVSSCTVKQERLSQLLTNSSGYENDVEFIPISDSVIDLSDTQNENELLFSDYNNTIDTINARVNDILVRHENDPQAEDDHYLSCTEPTTSNSSLEGRSRRSIKVETDADSSIRPPRIGPYISIEAPRKTAHRQALAVIPLAPTTTPNLCPLNAHLMFLHRVHIQSVRYSTIPTTWSGCGVFQTNPLTVHLFPASAGLFSVPVCDQQACLLLTGMSTHGKGTEALLAALAHVGKFRYGAKEPAREYYQLSITEKVLHLFFATIPRCPQNGGLVMFPRRKSSLPADGDEMWFERFNYYAHVTPNQRQRTGGGKGAEGEMEGESLARLLMPGIGRRMQDLRAKLLKQAAECHS